MPRYRLMAGYGYAGTDTVLDDAFECDSQEEAEKVAWEMAVERVDCWVELAEDDDQ